MIDQAEFLSGRLDRRRVFNFIPDLVTSSGEEYDYTHVCDGGLYFSDTTFKMAKLVLPNAPKAGYKISVADAYGSWKYYPLVIHRNGERIMSRDEDLNCDVPNALFSLTYINKSIGWKIEVKL